jgi:Uncharacterized protein conserved in bacteria (DUF2247).
MIKIEDFRELELKITWRLLDIGFMGSETFRNELSSQEIIDYAIFESNSNNDEDVFDLACEYSENIDKVESYLKNLVSKESTSNEIEFRKWRVVYVKKQLIKPNTDFINGLIELGDIWAKFNFPEDSPHIFQGRNNDITPEQYYTEENYKKLLNKHFIWVSDEITKLKT